MLIPKMVLVRGALHPVDENRVFQVTPDNVQYLLFGFRSGSDFGVNQQRRQLTQQVAGALSGAAQRHTPALALLADVSLESGLDILRHLQQPDHFGNPDFAPLPYHAQPAEPVGFGQKFHHEARSFRVRAGSLQRPDFK